MGNCVGRCATGHAATRYKVDKYDQQPMDTEQFANSNTIKLPFSAIFANVKIKKCPYKSIGIKISLDSEEYYRILNKPVKDGEDIKWKIEKKIDFLKTEYELRKSFVNIELIDETDRSVAFLRINLYTISVGPYHQDFMLEFKNGKIGRISFDFKVSQLIEINLESLETEINLNKKHPGENFSFSIKAIVSNDAKVSLASYAVQVILDERNSSQKSIEEESPEFRPRRRSVVSLSKHEIHEIQELRENNNLFWRKTDSEDQMPSINMKILLSELHHSYFQILLIKYDDKSVSGSENSGTQFDIKQQLFAECYISFHKLFTQNDPDTVEENGTLYEKRQIELNEKMWIHGKEVGKARFKFSVKNQKYIKQMQVCVRTEEGILKTSPVFGWEDDSKREKSCKEIDQLLKLSEELEGHVIQLEQCEDGYFETRKLKSKIEETLADMVPILEKTSKESMICYTYYSEKEMIKGQKVLIDLGQKITSYLEEEDLAINELCWQILIALIRRGEFMLNHIGFDDQERKLMEADNITKLTKKKTEVAIMYQQFMYKLLDLALKSLNYKGSEAERTFAEIFCAYAYFRIPDFRSIMLTVITREEDRDVPEWRGIEFSLNEDVDYTVLREDVDSFTALFDWHHSFHKCLKQYMPSESSRQDSYLELHEILTNDDWKYRFQKRGPAFFSFIKYWVSYVEGIVIKSRDIQWKYFPGYNRLLKTFFLEMKARSILEYPESLKETANRLIANENILTPIVAVLFSKANIYEPLSVIKAIEFIGDLLTTLKSKKKRIPTLFNYSLFFQAIRICLESEFLFVLESTLILLYTHFEMFHIEFLKNLCLFLLKKVFFRLFLHWSSSIRNVYYHLLVYRIEHEFMAPQFLDFKLQNTEIDTIKKNLDCAAYIKLHYENTLSVELQKAKLKKKEEKKSAFIVAYEKSLHKVMKKKLIEKKLAKAKKELLSSPKKTSTGINRTNPNNHNGRKDSAVSPIFQEEESRTIDDEKLIKEQIARAKKHNLDRFIQPRVERAHSECLPKNKAEVIYKSTHSHKKEEEVIHLNKSNSFTIKNEILDTTQIRDSNSSDQNNPLLMSRRVSKEFNPIFQMYIDEGSQQLVPVVDIQLQYIPLATEEFGEVKKKYEKSITKFEGKVEVPKITRQEMAIDAKELRPDKIDDW